MAWVYGIVAVSCLVIPILILVILAQEFKH